MAKKSRKRSLAAKRGWITRQRRARAEFKRRSIAAKKGWRRRHAKAKIREQAKQKPIRKGRLREFVVSWAYIGSANQRNKGSTNRMVSFVVIARNPSDAQLFVIKTVAAGVDSQGADLNWMDQVPWTETTVATAREDDPDAETLSAQEIKALGEGWVEIR